MELENMMSQATQDLNNGETRHESREDRALAIERANIS